MSAHDIHFMEHALTLARKSVGLSSPNPNVGCVIVNGGAIVSEGFHQYEWRDHAEIVALKSAGKKAHGATLYVNLEPCNHTGRTGPCTEAILEAGIARVVASIDDPNPKISGRGFERLQSSGVEITRGVLADEARRLNEAFACWIRTGKPFVTLKAGLTLDGQLALPKSKKDAREWITSEESRAEVHRMRHASDALVTGVGTIVSDNPLLTDRSGLSRRRHLLRVVLDSRLRISTQSRIVKTADGDLMVFTAASLKSPKAQKLQRAGIELMRARTRRGRVDLAAVLAELGRRGLISVLLESGPTLNGAALAAGLVDKLALFYAPKLAGVHNAPLASPFKPNLLFLRDARARQFGPDICVEAYPHAHRSS